MLLIRLERRVHTKEQTEQKTMGRERDSEIEGPVKENNKNELNESNEFKWSKTKKHGRSRGILYSSQGNKQLQFLYCFSDSSPSLLFLFPPLFHSSSIYLLMSVQQINIIPTEIAITFAIAMRMTGKTFSKKLHTLFYTIKKFDHPCNSPFWASSTHNFVKNHQIFLGDNIFSIIRPLD